MSEQGSRSGADLRRRLADAARRPIAAALAGEAARAAAALAAGAPGMSAVIALRGSGALVRLTGPGLFAREFGARDSAADPVIAPAIRDLKRRLA